FSVKSAYHALCNLDQQIPQWPWRYIWKVKVPTKVLHFSWLLAREACLTQENIRRRGFQLCSRCTFCGLETESNSHLFLHCFVTGLL
ncbi:hypothetical protein MTR67_049044, partial [Solanum verrucosum]